MWKMFDETIECNECGVSLDPPPKFIIPPPPRPPFMGHIAISNCNEEEMALKMQQAWDSDMCEVMPILDASLYSNHSVQTSAMIAVLTLFIVLVVLISSLFVWKNKRKVQNFLPCKAPTRGPHISGSLPLGGGHSVTYEDPDSHLGHHRPLVMRHHHNIEILHGKSIHYPSGYPMTRSPPFLVSSSPGPDPYRSNDNVYEELGPGRDSDAESEPPAHSDDDFAEDELSLPGERSLNKSKTSTATLPAVSTPSSCYERPEASTITTSTTTTSLLLERNSVLSSSSSTQDASTATAASSSSHNNNSNRRTRNLASAPSSGPGGLCGIMQLPVNSSKYNTTSGARSKSEYNNITSTTTSDTAANIRPIQQMYDNQSNLMSLACLTQHQQQQQQQHQNMRLHQVYPYHHSLQHGNSNNNNNNNIRSTTPQICNTLDGEVARRNRINAQLGLGPAAAATIYRERKPCPNNARYPPQFYATNNRAGLFTNSGRGPRTNSRSMDRRHRITALVEPIEPAYGYAEPIYQENYQYVGQPLPCPAYIVPDYTSTNIWRGNASQEHHQRVNPHYHSNTTPYLHSTQLYSRGDSSFGSDSGYSHHTPASSIGRNDYDIAVCAPPPNPTTTAHKTTSKLAAALNFGWSRLKSSPNTSTLLNVQDTKVVLPVNFSSTAVEAINPNNNSAGSTQTSTLETSSSTSSAAILLNSQNNNEPPAQTQT